MSEQFALGIDIGGTKICACIAQRDGQILLRDACPTPAHSAEQVLTDASALAQSLLSKAAQRGISVGMVGIGAAGQVDFRQGIISYANDNLKGWTGTPVAARIGAALGLPAVVENDVRAMAIGEGRCGVGRGYEDVLYVAVGTGIGGAIVSRGQLLHGAHYTAGEVGYLVAGWQDGEALTIEQLASGPGIARQYHLKRAGATQPTLREIAELAAAGDALADACIRDGARLLGQVLAPAVTMLDPQVLIVGGGVPNIGPRWWDVFIETLRAFPVPTLHRVAIVQASLSNDAAMLGAAMLAYDHMPESA